MQSIRLEIFKAGTWTDSAGHTRTWTPHELDQIARDYDPELHQAPIVLGHPRTDSPAYGWIRRLERTNGTLVAEGEIVPELRDWVSRGLYRKRSSAFYPPDHPNNPTPGRWYLRHVGFLGGTPPAVAGLKDPAFGREDQARVVEIDFDFGQVPHSGADRHHQQPEKREEAKMKILKFSELKEKFLSIFRDIADDDAVILDTSDGPRYSEEDVQKKVEKAVAQAREKLEAEYAARRQEAEAELRAREHQGQVKEFLARLRDQGKLLPAWERAGLADFMESLPHAPEQAAQFAEGAEKQTPYAWFCEFLSSLPPAVPLGEAAARDQGADKPAGEQLVDIARGIKTKNPELTWDAAFAQAQREHPELARLAVAEGR